MGGGTKRPVGSGHDKQARDRPPASRRREASPPPSDEAASSEKSRPRSGEAEPEEEPEEPVPSPRSSDTEGAIEHADAPDAMIPKAKKKPKQHSGPIRAGHHHSRGNRRVRSPSAAPRHRRRDSGASASAGIRDPPRGPARPNVPRPPLMPPPPALQRNVTLRSHMSRRHGDAAAASTTPPPPPPPPEGPTPEEHLRLALAFSASLDELERDALNMRGTLEDVKHHVLVHCLNLRHQFHLPG